jgi:hypothetical protein
MPKTPWFLWPPVVMLAISLVWFLAYELVAVIIKVIPTISSLVAPNIWASRTSVIISVVLTVVFLAFIGFLIYDWFFWHRILPVHLAIVAVRKS